jgi:hypothetical protein
MARLTGEKPVPEPAPEYGFVRDIEPVPEDQSWRAQLRAEQQRIAALGAEDRAYHESVTGDDYDKDVQLKIEGYRDRLVTDDAFRWDVATAIAEFTPATATPKAIKDRLATDDLFRWQVAESMTPIDFGRLPPDAFEDVPEGVPADAVTVDEPALGKDEPVEIIRMGPSLARDAQEPVSEAVPEPVDEPVEQFEMPPVADDVERAARKLGIQVWGTGLIPRAELHAGLDQALAHAVERGWLTVDGARIVRGEVDPRPVSVSRIPNF